MDAEDVDAWYDEEKEKIFEKYLKELQGEDPEDEEPKKRKKKQKPPEVAQKIYLEEIKKAREKYLILYEKSQKPTIVQKVQNKVNPLIDKSMTLINEKILKK